jgi:RNA 2',3'-cyclic 3'-phosphodiesterase
MTRAFVALTLPEELAEAAEDIAVDLPLPRIVPAENMHLTLLFLGEVGGTTLQDLNTALSEVRAPGFTLQLGGLDTFGGERPRSVHLRCAPEPGLDHLQRKVATAVRRIGLVPQRRRFTPHVTLARFTPSTVDRACLGAALLAAADARLDPFEVTDFRLMASRLGRSGASYDMLARYPLEAAP